MIKSLRKKFISIAMLSVAIVLITVLLILNLINYLYVYRNSVNILNYLALNEGSFPNDEQGWSGTDGEYNFPFSEETPFETRYFSVLTTPNGSIAQINMSHIAAVSATQAYFYTKEALERGKRIGIIDSYYYRIVPSSNGSHVVFLDRREEFESVFLLALLSICIGIFCLIIVYILLILLSKWAIAPIIENIEKQKQFIADAGHEIKTPLAIISADADVIEIESGRSEWTESIRNQTSRLNELVQDMLLLARMEDSIQSSEFRLFCVSRVAEQIVEEFKPLSIREGILFDVQIEPGIEMNGSEKDVYQLFSVLLNNAFKYVSKDGRIVLSLYKKRTSVYFDLMNTVESLPEGNLEKLFDRFYRADIARSRETGGYGIGLSIARAVCELHQGQIQAKKMDEHAIRFRAILSI